MCTYHKVQLKKAARHGKIDPALWNKLNADFEEFSDQGIEPSMPLAVITGEREVVVMTWGFRRRFKRKDGKPGPDGTGLTAAKPVVNAQSEKMGSYMWKDAYQHRRCIVPVTEFYEWTGPTGAKVAHRFHMGGDCFFVAGLWEESPEFGLCHTMLTTEPNREVAATGHDRCLVALLDHEIDPWLDGMALADFHRPDGMFQVESNVPNPRGGKRPEQGELF
ncbi:SOS response-associated peptidase family protein [Luteolibacter arcticus]|uniref:Abasic site processing protein n=1 Tax=Luteolibacter arcticus TaxID=1581411 RepID=A0ABT3GBL3_9BACT|nr:SOS response-associated peptidase family protein [Luteolibacter arcticus]MCW1921015.1 SOS response-associated peptidase family protein [Luteolibacter arcticus]